MISQCIFRTFQPNNKRHARLWSIISRLALLVTLVSTERNKELHSYQKAKGESDIWEHFSIVVDAVGKELPFVSCDICSKVLTP